MSTVRIDGEAVDRRGVPIYPGDLLKSLHFTDRRRKQHYLYHTVVRDGEYLLVVPTSHLEPTKVAGGGRCWLTSDWAVRSEVIHGYGPGHAWNFNDRPKRIDQPVQGGGE